VFHLAFLNIHFQVNHEVIDLPKSPGFHLVARSVLEFPQRFMYH